MSYQDKQESVQLTQPGGAPENLPGADCYQAWNVSGPRTLRSPHKLQGSRSVPPLINLRDTSHLLCPSPCPAAMWYKQVCLHARWTQGKCDSASRRSEDPWRRGGRTDLSHTDMTHSYMALIYRHLKSDAEGLKNVPLCRTFRCTPRAMTAVIALLR